MKYAVETTHKSKGGCEINFFTSLHDALRYAKRERRDREDMESLQISQAPAWGDTEWTPLKSEHNLTPIL